MIFQKKIDRAFNWLKEKNKNQDSNKDDNYEEVYLEKKDHLALILSALIVFSPIFIVLIGILILVSL